MQALPTEYKNRTFRSRTEARWAMLFDLLGIHWEYEHEAYRVETGGKQGYWPDFEFPQRRAFVEIKPSNIPNEAYEIDRWTTFRKGVNCPFIVLSGIPLPNEFRALIFVRARNDKLMYRTYPNATLIVEKQVLFLANFGRNPLQIDLFPLYPETNLSDGIPRQMMIRAANYRFGY